MEKRPLSSAWPMCLSGIHGRLTSDRFDSHAFVPLCKCMFDYASSYGKWSCYLRRCAVTLTLMPMRDIMLWPGPTWPGAAATRGPIKPVGGFVTGVFVPVVLSSKLGANTTAECQLHTIANTHTYLRIRARTHIRRHYREQTDTLTHAANHDSHCQSL